MGSDKRSSEKKRRRNSSSEEEDGKGKRERKSDSKKEKGKDKKSHKHRSDKEKTSKDKRRDKHQKHDQSHDFKELSIDDYFSKNNEFATWLKEKKKVFFSELSSVTAHEMFSDFVKAWNNQKLDSRYYEGITSAPRTAHNWKIRQ